MRHKPNRPGIRWGKLISSNVWGAFCFCFFFTVFHTLQTALGYHGDRGLLSSLVGWISGNATPSFIEGQSLSAEVRDNKATTTCVNTIDHISRILHPHWPVNIYVFFRSGLPGWCWIWRVCLRKILSWGAVLSMNSCQSLISPPNKP